MTARRAPAAPLVLDEVSFAYGRAPILSRISMTVAGGEVIALIGPNGAGKTTLLKIAAGILRPSAGRVVRAEAAQPVVAYLSQAEPLPEDFTVREIVELGRLPHAGLFRALSRRDHEAVGAAIGRTGLERFAERTLATLSGGERQRVALARALAQEPLVLLLDEPTNHLDPLRQVELFTTLRAAARGGMGVVAVVHDLAFASQADRCILLAEGAEVASGSPEAVLQAATLSAAYGTAIEVVCLADGRRLAVPSLGGADRSA